MLTRSASKADATASSRPEKLLIAFLICLPLEGILRKWALPGIQAQLVLLRDPIVILAILYCWQTSGRVRLWLFVWFFCSVALALYGTIQILAGTTDPLIVLLGIRNYVLFIPIAFIAAEVLHGKALARFIRVVVWLSIPSAVIAVLQFWSPVEAYINRGLSDDANDRMLVAEGIVRTNGLFTFTLAQSTFISFVLVLCLIGALKRKELGLSNGLIGAGLVAALCMGVVSGSRTFFISAGILFLVYALGLVVGAISGRQQFGQIGLLLLVVSGFAIMLVFVFPTALDAILQRQANAVADEGSTFARIWTILTEFTEVYQTAPPLGAGLGAGTNVAEYMTFGTASFRLAEYDLSRIVLELGPVVGSIVVAARLLGTGLLFVFSLAALWRAKDLAPLIAFSFAGPMLLVEQITAQNQMISFCWLAVGVNLATLWAANGRKVPTTLASQRQTGARSLRNYSQLKGARAANFGRSPNENVIWTEANSLATPDKLERNPD